MASPGQRRGNCGHIMAAFDGHKKCARCRDKKLGDDPCVKNQLCTICDSFTEQQRSMLSTPQYKIRKDKKSGLLVSPSKVTVVGVVPQEELGGDELEEEDVPVQASGSGDQEVFSITHHSPEEFVSKQDFDNLNNKLEEKFARFEALLTRTNIFSTPKAPVTNTAVTTSEQPFFNPSEPGATGLVRPPASDGQISHPKDAKNKGTGKKLKKKKTVPTATVVSEAPAPVKEHTVSTSIPSNRRKWTYPFRALLCHFLPVVIPSSNQLPFQALLPCRLRSPVLPVSVSPSLLIRTLLTLNQTMTSLTRTLMRVRYQTLKPQSKTKK